MFKEIVGTIVGVLPFAVMVVVWGVRVETAIATNSNDIRHLQEQRVQIDAKLDKIADRLEQIAVDTARIANTTSQARR